MKKLILFLRSSLIAVPVLFAFTAVAANAQIPQEPYQEKLLNGLKVLVWNNTGSDKITVKIRVHSGSAFDPQGREGVMRLLAESIFPNDATRDFFREDLSGSLEIKSTYDYIEIDATAKQEALLSVLETLASAVTNPAIDKDTTTKLRNALLAKVKTLEADPAYVADQAVAKRLFGSFPYGRPEMGTIESLQKIEFPDLLDAKKRFLTADNATIAVSGNFNRPLSLRAIRRYFGPWLKSDKLVPATFKQPDAPDTKAVKIEMPGIDGTYSRSAQTGPARNDKDYYSIMVYYKIRQEWRCMERSKYQANLLRGVYVRSYDVKNADSTVYSGPCPLVVKGSSDAGFINQGDFDGAKTRLLSAIQNQSVLPDLWLDVDTYRLASAADEIRKANAVTLTDVKYISEKLYKTPAVNVLVTLPAKTN